ncbi:hypothetical protein Marpi_1230 [Marinitoga piezophila KA3]|uniref:EpsG family protein n=1 Tax=Marinitoga piezophila (strain DSM 14283 / JCM 11233 / KA3) TaxID=443254 RepID=H2J8F0_MARPK|nr:hypothetical protein Marpi_1230 [Marinitoga piezophila KA3]
MIYLIPSIIVILLNSFIYKKYYAKNYYKKAVLFFGSSIFVFISSLRYKTGTDWTAYYDFFNKITNDNYYSFYFEPLFKVFSILIKNINSNFNFYLFCISINFVFLILIIDKILSMTNMYYNKSILFLSVYLYTFSYYMGGIRQQISFFFSTVSLFYLLKNKKILSLIFFIIGFLFHYSAILFLVNYIIYHYTSDKKNTFLTISFKKGVLILIIFFILIYGIFETPIFTLSFGNSNLIKKYIISYRGNSSINSILNYSLRNFILIFERVIILIIIFLVRKNYTCNKISKFFFIMYIFGSIFYIFFMFIARNIAGRGILYFRYADIFFFSTLSEPIAKTFFNKNSIKHQNLSKFISTLILLYLLIRFYVTILVANKIFYYPYKNIVF